MNIPKIPPLEGQIIAPDRSTFQERQDLRSWRLAGLAFAVLSAAFFSLKPVLIKMVYTYGVDTWTLMLLRMMFALPFVFFIAWHALHQRRAENIHTNFSATVLASAAALGLMTNYAAQYFDMLGLHYITAQFERLIIFTYPTLVVLIMVFFKGEKINRIVLGALIICYFGLALIFGHDLKTLGSDVITGAGVTFLSACLFALYFVTSKQVIHDLGSRIFTFLTIASGTLAIAVHYSFVNDLSTLVQPMEVYGLIMIIAVTGTVMPLRLWRRPFCG